MKEPKLTENEKKVQQYLDKVNHFYWCLKCNCWMDYAGDSTWRCDRCTNWIPIPSGDWSIVEKRGEM